MTQPTISITYIQKNVAPSVPRILGLIRGRDGRYIGKILNRGEDRREGQLVHGKLSARKRKEIVQKAAKIRWGKES